MIRKPVNDVPLTMSPRLEPRAVKSPFKCSGATEFQGPSVERKYVTRSGRISSAPKRLISE